MRTKMHKTKEETRAAIEKEIAAISTDLERLRAIIHRATDPQTAEQASAGPSGERHTDALVN